MDLSRAAVGIVLLFALSAVAPARTIATGISLPLAFEANRGQTDARVRFVARGAGHAVLLTDDGARIVVGGAASPRSAVVDIRLDGARPGVTMSPRRPLPGAVHYLRDADPTQHIVDVPTYGEVTYEQVYPGIDLVYHGAGGALEYDFVVAPHADPRRIALRFIGAELARVDADGALALRTESGGIVFRRPVAYQEIGGARTNVDADYRIGVDGRVGFAVGRYDRRHPLVIDPVLALASNLWGAATGVALDPAGNIYVVGWVSSADLPVAGGYQTQPLGTVDAYVVKLNPAGTAALYSTYLGARRATTQGLGIAVDAAGNAYVTGTTTSSSYPVTPGAYQSSGPAFVTKLKPAGNALAWSTMFGASVASIAVHADGSVALTGTTSSLTTTPGAFQPARPGAASPYVARLNTLGSAMIYATYLGGSGNDEAHGIAVDGAGSAYVVGTARSANFPTHAPLRPALSGGSDAFVAKLSPSGAQLVYSTYLGGSSDERGFGIAVDDVGRATAVGWTRSSDFPATSGSVQPRIGAKDPDISNAFVAAFDATGSALRWATYLGGNWCLGTGQTSCFGIFGADDGIDVATTVAIDAAGFTYVGGYATSELFPLLDPVQTLGPGSEIQRAPFVARIRPGGGRLVYSTILGARTTTTSLDRVAADGRGGVVAVGTTLGELFPLTAGAILGPSTTWLLKLVTGAYPTSLRSSVNPAARGQAITLTADVDMAPAGSTVTFKDGANVLGTAIVVDGNATFNVTLSPGVHRIAAINNAEGKVSPTLFQAVSGQ